MSQESLFEKYTIPEPNSGCLLWIGYLDKHGYGVAHIAGTRGRNTSAHRIAWELYKGEIPEGECVLHRCDNPPCVNVNHLFLGTQSDNMKDAGRKGRMRKGSIHHNAKLSDADVVAIRASTGLQKDIATQFGISRSNVSIIRSGKGWRHVELVADFMESL